jgi:hypothetical protein
VGKLEREIAPPLLAAPPSDLQAAGSVAACGTEHAGEGGKAIVPVMVSGNEEQLFFSLAVAGKRCIVGIEAAALILLHGCVGVGEVTAEDQDLAAVELPVRRIGTAHRERGGGHEVGHGIGRLVPVAEVGDEIDPQRPVLVEDELFGSGAGEVVA